LLNIVGIVILQDIVIVLDAVDQFLDVFFDISLITELWGLTMLLDIVLMELLSSHNFLWFSEKRASELICAISGISGEIFRLFESTLIFSEHEGSLVVKLAFFHFNRILGIFFLQAKRTKMIRFEF